MNIEKEVSLSLWVPESLKYRLDRATVDARSTLKETVIKILDEHLPNYEMA